MPTGSNPFPKGAAATLLVSAWLVACAAAWDRSTSSGGQGAGTEAARIAEQVARASALPGRCRVLAERLAEASIRAKVTELRPTARLMAAAERRALSAWEEAGCPVRALPGIAFGASRAAQADAAARLAGGRR